MNISIFGLGYVGCVSLGCLAKNGHQIIGVDVSEQKVNLINSGKATIVEKDIDRILNEQFKNGRISATNNYIEAINNTNLSIVAVGTPSSINGHLDLSYIFKVAKNIAEGLKDKDEFHVIVIRSTVMPGTCSKVASIIEKYSGKINDKDFSVVSNPEFLREGTAVEDFYNPPYTLIGSENNIAIEVLSKIYSDINGEKIIVKIKEAEIIKYINNSFHALKVTFANEVGNICKALEIDSHVVMDIFSQDKQLNISPYYLKPGFAYGGSCLPKDLKALQTVAHDYYLNTPVLSSINKSNDYQIERAVNIIEDLKFKKIGVLGLSFKAGTDDLRNSPTVSLLETLLGKGYDISIYDENVSYSSLTGRNKDYIDFKIPHLRNMLKTDPEVVIKESEIILISLKDNKFKSLVKNINDKIILDLVRLDEELIKKKNYIGLNW